MWDMASSYRHRAEGLCWTQQPQKCHRAGAGAGSHCSASSGAQEQLHHSLPPVKLSSSSPRTMFVQTIQTMLSVQGTGFAHSALPSSFTASKACGAGFLSSSWKHCHENLTQLPRKFSWSLKAFPQLLRNRHFNQCRKRGSDTKPTFMTVIPESDI